MVMDMSMGMCVVSEQVHGEAGLGGVGRGGGEGGGQQAQQGGRQIMARWSGTLTCHGHVDGNSIALLDALSLQPVALAQSEA